MNLFFFLYCVALLCYGRGIKSENKVEPVQDPNFSITTETSKTTTSSGFPEYVGLISAQDALMVEDNADEKIEKVVNTIKKISSSCVEYQSIKLSTNGYSYSENSTGFSINLGEKKASFHNFSISHWNDYHERSFLIASTLLSCTGNTSTIEIGLANNIKISANLKITNPSGKLVTKEGTISVVFKNAAISHQITPNTSTSNTQDVDDSNYSKLSYDNSEASVKIDTKFQTLIYNKIDVFLNEIESSLRQFFVKQLVNEINKRNISPTDMCSEIMKKDPMVKLANSSVLSSILNDIYVIPKVEQDTWNEVTLSAGPILIFELFPHDSAEFILKESWAYDQYYGNRTVKELISRIKTNSFKGNLDWRYNSNLIDGSNPLSVSFSAENLQIDSTSRGDRHYFVDANIEKIEIKVSGLISCESEKRFIDIILSEYLKSVIAKSIANSITQKLQNNPPSYVCVDNGNRWG